MVLTVCRDIYSLPSSVLSGQTCQRCFGTENCCCEQKVVVVVFASSERETSESGTCQ